jgi:nucleotide-binding universal stress UspA family protein
MTSRAGGVVVGIDGSEVAGAALAFAAREAGLRNTPLVIAHAGWEKAEVGEVRSFSEVLCREAIVELAASHPHLDYQLEIREDDPARLLLELSGDADLLVVGTHRTGRLRGWVLGSVSQLVAARANCPVVTVTRLDEAPDPSIVLGASASSGGLAALAFACEEARLRGVSVRAIRSVMTEDWALSGPGVSAVLGFDVLRDAAQAELDTVLRTAKESYPDVTVIGDVSTATPFLALLEESHSAAMLVIGSRRSRQATLPHLGPVAAWLLHQASCPLAVVSHEAGASDPPSQ